MNERKGSMSGEDSLGKVKSVESIRAEFPALARRHGGEAVAYFDGPGGTQVPRAVVEAMGDYLFHHNANTHWAYPSSEETDAIIEQSRAALADFLNATPNEIVFGANMTTLTFHLSRALGRNYHPGDEIIVTELDHHANVAPWRALEQERGIKVQVVRMIPETGQIDWNDFAARISDRTRLVAIGAASNALGTINDLPRVVSTGREAGAQVFIDAVHYAPHELVDVQKLGCDFLACSAYKFYGPHLGILYGKHDLLSSLDFPKLIPAPDGAPERAETGTQNHEGITGAAAAVDFLAWLGSGVNRRDKLCTAFDKLRTRGAELVTKLWQELAQIKGVRLFGPPPSESRTPTIAFVVEGLSSAQVAVELAERGLFLSHGDFYAATVVERLGLSPDGLVRAGCACYTTSDEIERLLRAVREVAETA